MSGQITVRRMQSRREMRAFHLFQWEIYRNDPLWVPPLLPERMEITDPERGMFFKRGEADFFAAFRANRMVGTICAARDRQQIREIGRPECVFGFFETLNDRDVASALFRQADAWARDHGLTSLHGPFNLDYEDGYGILTEGRDRKPVILCGHTPPYYQELVESLGFAPARAANIARAVNLADPPQELDRLERAAEIARRRDRFRIRGADVKHWREEAVRVHHLLNNSLANTGEARIPWPMEAVESLIRPVLKIADPDLVLFADRVGGPDDGTSIGWFAGIPNMNEIIEHLNGLRRPWDYLRVPFAYLHRPRGLAAKSLLVLPAKSLLVLPAYHSTGVAALLFDEMRRRAQAKRYSWIDLSLTSEANPQTPVIAARAGANVYKRYQVYRRATA